MNSFIAKNLNQKKKDQSNAIKRITEGNGDSDGRSRGLNSTEQAFRSAHTPSACRQSWSWNMQQSTHSAHTSNNPLNRAVRAHTARLVFGTCALVEGADKALWALSPGFESRRCKASSAAQFAPKGFDRRETAAGEPQGVDFGMSGQSHTVYSAEEGTKVSPIEASKCGAADECARIGRKVGAFSRQGRSCTCTRRKSRESERDDGFGSTSD